MHQQHLVDFRLCGSAANNGEHFYKVHQNDNNIRHQHTAVQQKFQVPCILQAGSWAFTSNSRF
jgi:hypothetical protein